MCLFYHYNFLLVSNSQISPDVLTLDQKSKVGWKFVRGEVFRLPTEYPALLSALVGTGMQVGMLNHLWIPLDFIVVFMSLLCCDRCDIISALLQIFLGTLAVLIGLCIVDYTPFQQERVFLKGSAVVLIESFDYSCVRSYQQIML